MELLSEGKRVINIDESWINETSFIRRTWAEKGGQGNTLKNAIQPRISMISALDTDGNVWFTVSQSNTNSKTMVLFLNSLATALSRDLPGWQEDTVFLLDNAAYHSSRETKDAILTLGI